MPRRGPAIPLLVALACALLATITGLLALGSPGAHDRDAAMLHGFVALDRPGTHAFVEVVAHLADPLPYGLAGLALVGVAVTRGRRVRAGAVVALLVLTGVTTRALKHATARPRFEAWLGVDQVDLMSWPSGHATAAMTLALCAVLVAPPAWRAVVAVAGGAFAAAVGYAVIVLAWHFPSDVLAGFLVAGGWTALAVAALRVVEARPAGEPGVVLPRGLLAGAIAAAAAACVVALLVISRDTVAFYAAERPTLVVGAIAIAALAAALSGGLARAA